MMLRALTGTLALALFCTAPALAWEPEYDLAAPNCERTPTISTSNYPGFSAIYSGNNLIQPAGKAEPFAGELVYVKGRIFDSACVPVADAKVEMWQADGDGRYRIATKAALAAAEAVFTGAGRTTTDNEGRFEFITLYPSGYSFSVRRDDGSSYRIYRAPHLNLRLAHERLKAFNTNLFFAGDPENSKDQKLKKLSDTGKERVIMHLEPLAGASGGYMAIIDIILPEKQAFRTY